ncbi:MAG: transporter [candidate division NC10 bacterium]
MKKLGNKYTQLLTVFTMLATILSFSGPVLAVDDGARAYWKGRDGTNGVSFQYLRLDLQASDTQQFAPGQYIYPNSDTEANIFIANYVRHLTLFKRPSSLSLVIVGGTVDLDVNARAPGQFVPPGIAPGTAFSQSSSGFADPSVQLVVNLFGTPPLKSGVDLLNYEPTWTLDIATMLAFPIGEYDDDKLVNMGLNRWFGRIAFPFKYHFGAFTPGYMTSLEFTPSVWLFAENDDFIGQKLENDPMWQLEAHLTHDFTASFFGSLDLLYRGGFQSEIDGVEVGDELDIGNLGFTLNYQITDNVAIRTGFSSNVFGDDDLDTSVIRIQFVYAWHTASESMKKLRQGH